MRAQLFTVDLLIALIPLTIALGVSAAAFSGLAGQVQDYAYYYDAKRTVTDVLDVLMKSPGVPPDWNTSNPPEIPGLVVQGSRGYNNLSYEKLQALNVSMLTPLLPYPYINLSVYTTTGELVREVSQGSRSGVSEVFGAERFGTINGSTPVRVLLEVGR